MAQLALYSTLCNVMVCVCVTNRVGGAMKVILGVEVALDDDGSAEIVEIVVVMQVNKACVVQKCHLVISWSILDVQLKCLVFWRRLLEPLCHGRRRP